MSLKQLGQKITNYECKLERIVGSGGIARYYKAAFLMRSSGGSERIKAGNRRVEIGWRGTVSKRLAKQNNNGESLYTANSQRISVC